MIRTLLKPALWRCANSHRFAVWTSHVPRVCPVPGCREVPEKVEK